MNFPKNIKFLIPACAGLLMLIWSFTLPSISYASLNSQKLAFATPVASFIPFATAFEKSISVFTSPSPIKKIASNSCQYTPDTWIGKASYYTWDGCMGCNGARQMANGEILEDDKPTIAFMRAPLNTVVEVKNLDTGAKIVAKVTDRGGFEPLGRIADVSAEVKDRINLATDESTIQITSLNCA